MPMLAASALATARSGKRADPRARASAALRCSPALGLALVFGAACEAAAAAPVAPLSSGIQLACLDRDTIDEIRGSGDLDAAYKSCDAELTTRLGPPFMDLDEHARRAILASIVAGLFAEYGPGPAILFEDIATSDTLNCLNTTLLTGYLFAERPGELKPVGFDYGAIGNHAQLAYDDGRIRLLLDPTTGLVARIGFDELLQGKKPLAVREFAVRGTSIEGFRRMVFDAVRAGRYRPSDLLYVHQDAEQLADAAIRGSSVDYFTPAGLKLRQVRERAGVMSADAGVKL